LNALAARRSAKISKIQKTNIFDAPCRVTFIYQKNHTAMHGTTTKRTGARAWVQIVPTPFPQYGGIITPPRVWRQIVLWIAFF
jgi:hypothetical protein